LRTAICITLVSTVISEKSVCDLNRVVLAVEVPLKSENISKKRIEERSGNCSQNLIVLNYVTIVITVMV
jgi:hypothetical protein